MTGHPIGSVEILYRYPVKGMKGEELAQTFVSYSGLMGDRVYALVDPTKAEKFPWHTVRDDPQLLLYEPRFRTSLDPRKPYPPATDFTVDITTPDGRHAALTDEDFLGELRQKSGCNVALRFSEKSMQDARPISIFGLDTLQALEEEAGCVLDHRRFRANFYVRWTNERPFYEDELVDRRLRIGATMELMIVKKDPRCKVITVDPDNASINPAVLKTIARKHAGCAGVYAAVLREGVVEQGAAIYLL